LLGLGLSCRRSVASFFASRARRRARSWCAASTSAFRVRRLGLSTARSAGLALPGFPVCGRPRPAGRIPWASDLCRSYLEDLDPLPRSARAYSAQAPPLFGSRARSPLGLPLPLGRVTRLCCSVFVRACRSRRLRLSRAMRSASAVTRWCSSSLIKARACVSLSTSGLNRLWAISIACRRRSFCKLSGRSSRLVLLSHDFHRLARV
jgi:hypothetical protein